MTQFLFQNTYKGCNWEHKIDATPESNVSMHTHDYIEVFYLISGDCSYLIEGTEYRLKPCDILIMRPFEAHKLVFHSLNVPYERVVIAISLEMVKQFDTENTILPAILGGQLGIGNRLRESNFEYSLCSDCIQTVLKSEQKTDSVALIARTMLILSEIKSAIQRKSNTVRAADTGTRLIDYINQNLFTDLSLEQISREFYMSQSQINRIFKANTGSSVGQYITVKRLLTARRRVRAGESAYRVCVECGYHDYSAFYRAYVKRFGVSPQADKGDLQLNI